MFITGTRKKGALETSEVSQSVISRSRPALTPGHRLAVRLRHSQSNTSTEYSLPGAPQLSQVRSISPSGQGVLFRTSGNGAAFGYIFRENARDVLNKQNDAQVSRALEYLSRLC